MDVLRVMDKSERIVRLTKSQWSHIRMKHPEVEDLEQLRETLEKPDKITDYHQDPTIYYYYKYYKHRASSDKYLLVVIKYLNGDGYVLSSYFKGKIR